MSEDVATAAPVAASGIASRPFEASLVRDSAPAAAPPDCALKVTVKAVLCPAARVVGRLKPLTVKPAPEMFACDTVTLAVPELVNVASTFSAWPTSTLPKLRLEGLETSVPKPTATPDTGTLTTEFGASLVTAIVPLEVPVRLRRKRD